jgi:acyl-[acyl carrier protein]--UDP-N-acetylglucosamine O-acyltransferase
MLSKSILNFLKINSKKKIKLDNQVWFSTKDNLKSNTLCFFTKLNNKDILIINRLHNLIILSDKKNSKIDKKHLQISVKDPKFTFFEILKYFYKFKVKNKKPIIGKGSKICKTVKFGKNVIVGKNCKISSYVVIGDNVKIGNNVSLEANNVIGNDGFQSRPNKSGNLVEVCHVGGVKIGDHVTIGSFSTIDKGTIEDTVIGDYCKINSHIHIAHNCNLGKNNIIGSGVVMGGSVKVQDKNFFGNNCTLRSHVKLGSNNFVGQGSNVVKNYTNSNLIYGNPSKIIKKIKSIYSYY